MRQLAFATKRFGQSYVESNLTIQTTTDLFQKLNGTQRPSQQLRMRAQ